MGRIFVVHVIVFLRRAKCFRLSLCLNYMMSIMTVPLAKTKYSIFSSKVLSCKSMLIYYVELCETHIDELFKRIDEDDDGEISLQETLLFVEKHPEIDDIFGIFGRTIALQNLKPTLDENQDDLLDAVDEDEVDESRQEKYEKWKEYREKEKMVPSHTRRDTKLFSAIRNEKVDLNVLWDQLTQSIEIGTNSKARQEIDRRLDNVKLNRGVGLKMQK